MMMRDGDTPSLAFLLADRAIDSLSALNYKIRLE